MLLSEVISFSLRSVFLGHPVHSEIISQRINNLGVEMFYLNTIEQLLLFVEQLDHLAVCLPHSRLLTGIAILAVFRNLRWNSNKTSLNKTINHRSNQV